MHDLRGCIIGRFKWTYERAKLPRGTWKWIGLEGELAWNFGLFETCTDRCTQLLRIKRGHGPYLNQMAIGG